MLMLFWSWHNSFAPVFVVGADHRPPSRSPQPSASPQLALLGFLLLLFPIMKDHNHSTNLSIPIPVQYVHATYPWRACAARVTVLILSVKSNLTSGASSSWKCCHVLSGQRRSKNLCGFPCHFPQIFWGQKIRGVFFKPLHLRVMAWNASINLAYSCLPVINITAWESTSMHTAPSMHDYRRGTLHPLLTHGNLESFCIYLP